MTTQELQHNYDCILSTIGAMLAIQKEYWAGKKRGYNQPLKLNQCIVAENKAKALYKQLYIIRADTLPDAPNLVKEYLHFMERTKALLGFQAIYFKDKTNKEMLLKCKAVEHEITKLIATANKKQPQTLF